MGFCNFYMIDNGNTGLAEFRCTKCAKLLARTNDALFAFEIKCVRCGSLNSLLRDIDDTVVLTDADGYIVYVNDQVEIMTGYSITEVIGKRPSIWGHNMGSEFYEKLWHTIKDEKRAVAVNIENTRKDGSRFQAMLRISPILNKDGDVVYFVGITNRLTDSVV